MNVRKPSIAIIGSLALLAGSLACRPSWSPDGSKILFPYYDPRTHDVGVALYDRMTNHARSLFARRSKRWDDRVVIGQWGRDGQRAVLFSADQELLTLPVDSSRAARRIEVPSGVLCGAGPWPVIGDSLFCCGKRVVRIDLKDGSVVSRRYQGLDNAILLRGGDKIFYLSFVDRAREFIGYELGELTPENLERKARFRLSMRILEAHGIRELEGSMAFEPGGDRLALTARTEQGSVILLLGATGVEAVIVPSLAVKPYRLGNIEWAADSPRLFAAASSYGPEPGTTQLALADISLVSGESKLYPIVDLRKSYSFFEPLEIQVALSPDGETIAVATTYLDDAEVEPENRALYLLALDQPEPSLTKIVWPPTPG
jgi:hypothetical protein